jgi:hypothetical protein
VTAMIPVREWIAVCITIAIITAALAIASPV